VRCAFAVAVIVAAAAGLEGCETHPSVDREDQGEIDLIAIKQEAEDTYQRKEWASSEEHYVLLTQKMPLEPEPWFRLGNIYARTKRPDQAVRAYREAVIRDPQHSRAWHNMGVIQLKQAGRSFAELQLITEPTDPLYQRSREMVDAIENLIKKND